MRWKSLIVSTLVLGALELACAQQVRRRASPHDTTEASVDGAQISINYGRPSMRGREIFGTLVPYDRVWCPGADEATKLTTNRDLKIGDLKVPAGSYSLWMLPTAADWSLIINKRADAWHTRHPAQEDLGKVSLQKRTLETPIEQLTFSVEKNQNGSGGKIVMRWENTEVSAPLIVQ